MRRRGRLTLVARPLRERRAGRSRPSSSAHCLAPRCPHVAGSDLPLAPHKRCSGARSRGGRHARKRWLAGRRRRTRDVRCIGLPGQRHRSRRRERAAAAGRPRLGAPGGASAGRGLRSPRAGGGSARAPSAFGAGPQTGRQAARRRVDYTGGALLGGATCRPPRSAPTCWSAAQERFAAERIGLSRNATYMADLDDEIVTYRRALVGAYVTEIAVRRGERLGRQFG